jgi:hypothetical protein
MGKEVDLGFRPLARVQSAGPKLTRTEVVGTWSGTYKSDFGSTTLVLVFGDDGQVSGSSGGGRTRKGTWVRKGDSIQVTWSDGLRMSFRLKDARMSARGTGSRGESWTSSLERR